MDDRERCLRIEAIERRALADSDQRAGEEVRAALGRRYARWGDVLAMATDSNPSLLFNRVLGVGLGAPADDRLLDTIAAHFGAGRQHSIQLAPHAAPADLPARLRARGYGHYFSWVKWWRDLSPAKPVSTSLRVTAATPADRDTVRAVAEAAFEQPSATARSTGAVIGSPGWRYFIAWDAATAVAIAAAFVSDEGAWFGVAGTLPTHRGRGAQQALLAARIEAAREAGCPILTVETGPDSPERPNPSYHNVERAGFRVAYERPSWVFPDPGRRC